LNVDRLFLSYLHFHFILIYYLRTYYHDILMEAIDDVIPSEQIAFIAYNIGVYESVQKFGSLITSGKLTNGTDVSKMAELLSQSTAFYDADMIAGLINAMLHHTEGSTVKRVKPDHVRYVISQLKVTGVSLP
jgi:hypothetical protein